MILTALGIILFIALAFFIFPVLSPIPYFPSNHADMPMILKSLGISNDQTIIDLGAGEGLIVFQAANYAHTHNLNTSFVALEINPVLLIIMHIRRLLHPHRKYIKVMYGDMFKLHFPSLIEPHTKPLFYMYISPWLMEKILSRIRKQVNTYTIVSYMYRILTDENPAYKGVHDIFIQRYTQDMTTPSSTSLK